MKQVLFFFIFSFSFSYSQNNLSFYNHLEKNKLEEEKFHFLYKDTNGIHPDTLAYLRCRFQLSRQNDSLILRDFKWSEKITYNDTFFFKQLNVHFLARQNKHSAFWFDVILKHYTDSLAQQFCLYNKILNTKFSVDTSTIPQALNLSLLKLDRINHKKAFISAGLSMLLPGLGKLYNGRKYSFRNVFSAHVLLAAKFLESNYRLGLVHPYTMITFGFFTTYYFANILGSYYDFKEVRKEAKLNFLKDVQTYYTKYTTIAH